MRETTLPSPGILANGFTLRREAAKAISSVEIVVARVGGPTAARAKLADFFDACAVACGGGGGGTPPDTDPPAATGVIRAGSSAVISFDEAMGTSSVPPISAFSGTGCTPTGVSWVNPLTLFVSCTGLGSGDSVTYTVPGTDPLRDVAGNPCPNFTVTLP